MGQNEMEEILRQGWGKVEMGQTVKDIEGGVKDVSKRY